MPNLRRQPPAPPSTSLLEAVYDPTQPGGYAWSAESAIPLILQQGGSVVAPTPTTVWEIQPVDTTKAPFVAALGGGAFVGVWDYVFRLGYNAGDTQIVPGEPVAEFVIEASYQTGGKRTVELYWQWVDATGASSRPIGFGPVNVDGTSGQPPLSIANGLAIYMAHSPGNHTIARFTGDVNAGNTVFFDQDPGGSPLPTQLFMTTATGTSGEIRIADGVGVAFDLLTTAGAWKMTSALSGANNAGIYLGKSVVFGGGVANAATDGYVYFPQTASGGAPTGVPTTQDPFGTGSHANAIITDTTTLSIYAYMGGWHQFLPQDTAQAFGSTVSVVSLLTATGGVQVGSGGGGLSALRAGPGQDLYLGYGGGTGLIHLVNTANSDVISLDGSAAGKKIGFFGTAAGAKPTVTGSKGGNVALASLLTALAGLGLLTDSST